MVERGLAAALLPALSEAVRHTGVRVVPLPGRPRRRVFAATRAGGQGRPALVAVVDVLRSAHAGHQ